MDLAILVCNIFILHDFRPGLGNVAEVRLCSDHIPGQPSGHQLPSLAGRRAARIKGEENYETGLLLFGLATGLMWLRTLSFVLVQQDLGQALLLYNTCTHVGEEKRTGHDGS